jgi:hypothetical protein
MKAQSLWLWGGALLVLCASTLFFWRTQPGPDSSSSPIGVVSPRSLQELNSILRSGVSTQELLAAFGPPVNHYEHGESFEVWAYALSRSRMEESCDPSIAGFDMTLTNGRLANWNYIYRLGAGPAP